MTKTDKLRAFEMRLDGFTYEQISKELGYSKQHISTTLSTIISRGKPVVRPQMYMRVMSDYGSLGKFSEEHKITLPTLDRFFFHESEPSPRAITVLLKAYPKLTYEEVIQ